MQGPRRLVLWSLAVAAVATLMLADSAAAKCNRVEVCHVPPGGPGVFHTLTICDHVLPSHLAHGDVVGDCAASSEELCDDNNRCTVDEFDDAGGTERCAEVREPTDCDDDNECTEDSCDPLGGCVNLARTGAACNDGELCTGLDACSAAGACEGTQLAGCCTGDADCSPSLCANESCDLSLNECVANPRVCTPPDLCTASACDELTGTCAETPSVCPAGEICDLADGLCKSAATCPCDYSVYPKTVAHWGSEVLFKCPTAAVDVGLVGITAVVPPLWSITAELAGIPLSPMCGLVTPEGVVTIQPVSDPEFRACEAEVIDYLGDLLAVSITLTSNFGGVTDASTCLPVTIP